MNIFMDIFILVNCQYQTYSTFIKYNFLPFTDVNECQVKNGGCEHLCVNTAGSFYCTCKAGYTIDFDNTTCYGKYW